jgi:hypothetical protein
MATGGLGRGGTRSLPRARAPTLLPARSDRKDGERASPRPPAHGTATGAARGGAAKAAGAAARPRWMAASSDSSDDIGEGAPATNEANAWPLPPAPAPAALPQDVKPNSGGMGDSSAITPCARLLARRRG